MNATATVLTLPITPAEPKQERDWFNYRGREWRIFKPYGAKWYLYFEYKKKRYKHCLGEVEKRAAIETAKIKIAAVLDGHKDTLRASMQRDCSVPAYSTIPDLVRAYQSAPLDLADSTRRTNINCFKLILATAAGSPADELTTGALTPETGRRWFDAVLLKARAAGSPELQARAKRSGNSMFNQAKSLLRPKAIGYYQRSGLILPDVDPFIRTGKEEKFDGVTAVYDPPAESVIRATLHDWLTLGRNEFLAVGLELACGLRKGEVAQVTWGMWQTRMGSPILDSQAVDVRLKNRASRFMIPPIDPFWSLLNRRIARENWRGQAGELVLSGTATDLSDCIFRNVGAWLRGHGWKTQKTNHALRAYAGSLVAMKFDKYRASAWLRHASVKTTEQFYMHFLNGGVFRPENVRIRWAKQGVRIGWARG